MKFRALWVALVSLSAASCDCGGKPQTAFAHGAWLPREGLVVTGDEAVLDFGMVAFGSTKAVGVQLENDGRGTLTVDSPAAEAPFSRDALTASLSSTAQTTWEIRFSPIASHDEDRLAFDEQIEVATTGAASSQRLKLHVIGVGYAERCALPASIDFGAVLVGQTGSESIAISNNSPGVVSAEFENSTDSIFVWQSEALAVPVGGASDELRFTPTEAREYSASVRARASETCPWVDIAAHGVGVTELLTWTPTEIDCGWLPLLHEREVEVTFTNRSRTAVTLHDFEVTGDALAPNMTVEIPAETAVAVQMACRPTELGPRDAVVTFATTLGTQAQGSVVLHMKGGGPQIDVLPPVLNFGRIAWNGVGTPPTSRRLSIRNLGTRPPDAGTEANLHLEPAPWAVAMPVDGGGVTSLDVVFVPGFYDEGAGLAGGQATTLDVQLTAPRAGELEFQVKVSSDDGEQLVVVVPAVANAIETSPCQLSVTPSSVDWGILAPGESRRADLVLRNLGVEADEICFISAVDVGAPGVFELLGGRVEQLEIPPQGEVTLTVQGTAGSTLGDNVGALYFEVNTPGNSTRSIPLHLFVADKCVAVLPDPVEFGNVPVGCSTHRDVRVYNVCPLPQTYLGATSDGASFSVVSDAGSIAVAGSASISVQFVPPSAGAFRGQLGVELQGGTRFVELLGNGIDAGFVEESFAVPATAQMDLLVVESLVGLGPQDDVSMTEEEARQEFDSHLALFHERFASMVSVLLDGGVDLHAGMISPFKQYAFASLIFGVPASYWEPATLFRLEDGGVSGGFVTSDMENAPELFGEISDGILNTTGWCPVNCFEMPWRAVSEPRASQVNQGFARAGVPMNIIALSVLEDVSVPWEPDMLHACRSPPASLPPVQYYLDVLRQAQPHLTGFSTVTLVPGPPDCPIDDGHTRQRLTDMATLSGGVVADYCDDWNNISSALVSSLFASLRRFPLRGQPDSSAVMEVFVNGVLLAVGEWNYISITNTVELSSAPPPNSTVTVRYSPICE